MGLYTDPTLDLLAQVTHVSQKRIPYTLKNFLPPKTKTTIMEFLIVPLIDYGDVSYFDLNVDFLTK